MSGKRPCNVILTIFMQVHRTSVYNVLLHCDCWEDKMGYVVQKTNLQRSRLPRAIPIFVREWIHLHTAASSNIKNMVVTKVQGRSVRHVIHWRTELLDKLYTRCKLDVANCYNILFKKTYFYSLIPQYVKIKRKQEGLCPTHHTGKMLAKELIKKRQTWHENCVCSCLFCSTEGCKHGR